MSIAEPEVAYPAHLEADVVLRNGRALRIRPVRIDDHERMRAFFSTLSPETLHARFFAVCTADQALIYAPSQVDYVHEFGVVGEVGSRIVAVAHYYSSAQDPRVAEVAFAIADDQQGFGIGTLLMEKLAVAARMNHIERFEAEVLDENARMLDVFLQSGYVVRRNTDHGTTHVSFAIEPTATSVARTASRSQNAARAAGKTILATFMSAHGVRPSLEPVPAFPFPERAVGALARAVGYAEWRRRPEGEAPELNLDTIALRSIVNNALERGGGWLDPNEIEQLLRASGIESAGGEFVSDAEQAFEAAVRIGKPVALKAIGPKLLHKSDRGGVRLSLKNEREAQEAFLEMKTLLGDDMEAAFVQPMMTGGVEIMLGATNDPTFGHVLAFGAGGTLVEVLSDVAFRVHPLTPNDAEDMINELRCAKMLAGVRGAAPSDVPALRESIMRLSALISICPEIQELDINPLKVLEKGTIALDARVRVERVAPAPPSRRIAY
jgi:GNAT superfamily N-acetyltransferase